MKASPSVTLVSQALALAPGIDLGPPGREIASGLGARIHRSLELRNEFRQALTHITHDRHIDLDALGDRRRIDIDMDDLAGILGEVLGVSDHPVIEPRADRHQHIAVLHGEVGLVGAMHARHANKMRAAGLVATQPHQGVGAGIAEKIDQLVELGGCVGQDDSATGIDHGALGLQQQLNGLFDLSLVPLDHRVVGAHRYLTRVLELAFVAGHILGDVDQHRTRATG
jgi:hypothetical protein